MQRKVDFFVQLINDDSMWRTCFTYSISKKMAGGRCEGVYSLNLVS